MDGLQWKIPIKMDDLEVSLFQETCTYIYIYVYLFNIAIENGHL